MQISFSSVWQNLIDFVKNPRANFLPNTFLEQPQKIFPYLLGIDFLLMIPLSMIMGLAGVEETENKVVELLNDPIVLIGMAVFAAPILEEAIFRFPIGRKGQTLAALFGEQVLEIPFLKWWYSNFKTVFWLFTFFFAVVHLTNYTSSVSLYLAPLLVLPQFILGIMLGYIRIGWGFWYGVLFHAVHNGILVGLATLGGALGTT